MHENIYYKKNDKPFEKIEENQYLVLSESTDMTILNDMAFYIWSNSDGKTIIDLAHKIYNEILNKDEVRIEQIINDCQEVFEHLLSLDLVRKEC